MKVRSFHDGGYASVCYLVTDEAGTAGVIVDPSVSPSYLIRSIGAALPPITAIILTHGHFDHMLALDEWRAETGAPLLISRADAPALGNPTLSCYHGFLGTDTVHAAPNGTLSDGDTVAVGDGALRVMSTPGHTPGSIVLVGDGFALTGDTLFADGGYGRYDLPGGDGGALYASISRLLSLPDDTLLYPGHGRPTRLSDERPYHM